MKTTRLFLMMLSAVSVLYISCGQKSQEAKQEPSTANEAAPVGQSGVVDDISQQNVVKVAVGSPDHTTLVAAVKAGELVDALSNAGPFSVFAPTNAAFDKLPKGTVEDLLKPENKTKLQNILQYHVTVSVFETDKMFDGQKLGMFDDKNSSTTITKKDGKTYINGSEILGSVRASNGIVHVINDVLLPPQ